MKKFYLSKFFISIVLFFIGTHVLWAQCFISNVYVSPSTSICSGSSAQLSVFASTPSGFYTLQWYQGTSFAIPGATSSTYFATTPGDYWCGMGSNECFAYRSNTVTIQVNSAPVATISASGPTAICSGNTVTLGASSGSGLPSQYKWQLNGSNITGATSSSYVTNSAGNYRCIVSNTCGTDTSAILPVTVLATPMAAIYSDGPTMLCNGGTTLLSTDTNSHYRYAWYRNNVLISGMFLPNYLVTTEGSYFVTVKDTTDNCSANSASVNINLGPLVVSVAYSPASPVICSGTNVTLTATANVSVTGYQWKKDGVIVPGATNPTYVFTATNNSTYTIDLMNSCGTFTSAGYTPTILPLPGATITTGSSTAFCDPDSVVLNANTGTSLAYQWYLNTNSFPILNAVNPTYTVTATGNYFVRITDATTGCSVYSNLIRTSSNGIVASVTPAGPLRVCHSLVLSANSGTGYTYQWRINGTNIAGATSQIYIATTIGTNNYDVIITGGCGSNTSNSVNVGIDSTVIPHSSTLIFINISTCSGVCGGLNLTMCGDQKASVGFNRFFPYGPIVTPQWYLNGDTLQNPFTYLSATDYNNWVLERLTLPGLYYCSISNGCGITWSDTNTLVVNPLPIAVITANGPTTFCSGGSVLLSANTGTGLLYQWKYNGNGIQGATSSTYTATSSGTYTCIVTGNNGCGVTSNYINVYTGMATPTIVSNTTSFCQGGSILLSAPSGTGFSYQWQLNGGVIPGATSSTYSAGLAGSYSCEVTGSCGSATSDTITTTVSPPPVALITAGGSPTICAGSSVTLNANAGAGLFYQWQKNGANISNANLSSYTASVAGNYVCEVANSSCSVTSNTISIAVVTLPPASIRAIGSTTFCLGDSVGLSANTGTGLSYQWQLNGGVISGATSSSCEVSTTGDYICIVTNACGNTMSNTIAIIVDSFPVATVNAVGPTILCAGDSMLLNANSGTGFGYQWQLNGSDISGATFSTYTTSILGNYSCTISNACGSTISNVIVLMQGPSRPATPGLISGNNNPCPNSNFVEYSISQVSGAISYSWTIPSTASVIGRQDTTSILINFSSTFVNGEITVKAVNDCGTSHARTKSISKTFNCPLTVNGSQPNRQKKHHYFIPEIFPNPTSNHFTIKISSSDDDMYIFIIRDLAGREIERMENIPVDEQMDFGYHLSNGIYFAEVIQANERKVLRVVKSE